MISQMEKTEQELLTQLEEAKQIVLKMLSLVEIMTTLLNQNDEVLYEYQEELSPSENDWVNMEEVNFNTDAMNNERLQNFFATMRNFHEEQDEEEDEDDESEEFIATCQELAESEREMDELFQFHYEHPNIKQELQELECTFKEELVINESLESLMKSK